MSCDKLYCVLVRMLPLTHAIKKKSSVIKFKKFENTKITPSRLICVIIYVYQNYNFMVSRVMYTNRHWSKCDVFSLQRNRK